MPKIINPVDLNQGTEVTITPASKTITLNIAGNLSNDGVTMQCLYSFLKEEWKDDANLIKYDFPMISITNEQFELFNGWDFADQASRNLVRDGGWAKKDSSGNSFHEYMNITTLGTFDNSNVDQAYYIQETAGATNDIVLTGEVNQAIEIYSEARYAQTDYDFPDTGSVDSPTLDLTTAFTEGDTCIIRGSATNDGTYTVSNVLVGSMDLSPAVTIEAGGANMELINPTDYRSFFQIFLREQGKTYAFGDLIVDQSIASLTYKKYALPLTNGTDLKITHGDSMIAGFSVTNTTISFTNATKTIADSANGFPTNLLAGDTIVVTGSASNNQTFTVVTNPDNGTITVSENVVEESAGASVTVASPTAPYTSGAGMDITYHNGTGFQPWANSTVYPAKSVVSDGGRWYSTALGGTSNGTGTGDDTGVTDWTAFAGEVEIGTGNYYAFNVTIDGNSGTAEQIYEFVQYQLRSTGNIDVGGGTQIGEIADEMLQFVGDTLKTIGGVYISNFLSADTNRLVFVDVSSTERTYPYTAAGSISFDTNLQNDSDAKYWMFFTNDDAGDNTNRDFGTANAIIVDNNSGVDITGTIGGASSIAFDYDYDNNNQRGEASKGVDAPITIVALGLSTAQYVKTTGTIIRSTANNFSLVSALERNYSA